MSAKYPGRCKSCGGGIQVGDTILWEKGAGAQHASHGGSGKDVRHPGSRGGRYRYTARGKVRYDEPPKPRTPRERTEPPAGPTLVRRQGKPPFQRGDVVAILLATDEVSRLEATQGIKAVELSGSTPAPAGRRRVAVEVVWATSLTDDEVEDMDAWSHQHQAVVRLATGAKAQALLRGREAAGEKQRAAKALEESLGEGQGRNWQEPLGAKVIAREQRPNTYASLPYLVATREGAVYHVRPVYDDDSVVRRVAQLSPQDAQALAVRAGWALVNGLPPPWPERRPG
jgi:hypothetical protein